MNQPVSRREFLRLTATLAGGVGLVGLPRMVTLGPINKPNSSAPNATLPLGVGPRVVHVHASNATSWNFSSGWYGNYVNQNQVNNMVDRGLRELTGQATVATAWSTLLPGYAPGKGIAIKVNFNNSNGCNDADNIIDSLIEPVNALIRGMKLIGVLEQDIWVYDAIRALPARFRSRCNYPGVHFVDHECAEGATFDSTQPNASVVFANSNLKARHLADVLINATYLINMPIVKDHGISGVTLGFKNHFGSIKYVIGAGADNLHDFIEPGNAAYRANYSPIVEINANPQIRSKTVLIVGDGLYGALGNTNVVPSRWQTFGNVAANSLFFATDPVAIDCVMMDILYAEPTDHPYQGAGADDYLKLAAAAGLGVFEHGQPWGVGYTHIDYKRVEADTQVATLTLSPGWNLIGLPVSPAVNYTAESAAAEITAQGGNCTEIDRWLNGGWDVHLRGLPFNNFSIEPGSGFFFKCAQASVWSLTGYPIQQSNAVNLDAGWNLIAIPYSSAPLTAAGLLTGINAQGGSGLEVDRWLNDAWSAHTNGSPLNDFAIENGKGYFVKCSAPSIYVP
jgi:hypothetical protein